MSKKLAVVLTWAERIAAAVAIVAPAIRCAVAELAAAKAEVTRITTGDA